MYFACRNAISQRLVEQNNVYVITIHNSFYIFLKIRREEHPHVVTKTICTFDLLPAGLTKVFCRTNENDYLNPKRPSSYF